MEEIIEKLKKDKVLKTPNIVNAFASIDRKDFVLDQYKQSAYEDIPLPIGYGQTISQPYTVAFMLELLKPRNGQKILDIGSGSGWQTALLARIVGEKGKVFAFEIIPELKEFGEKNINKYNFIKKGIVKFFAKTAENGFPEEAPFDGIIAAASTQKIPTVWKKQLSTGGRIVAPVENSILLIEKINKDTFKETEFPGFAFVPFVSK